MNTWFIEDNVYWNNNNLIKELIEVDNDADLIAPSWTEQIRKSIKFQRLFFHEVLFATLCKMKNYVIKYHDELELPHNIYYYNKLYNNLILHPVK